MWILQFINRDHIVPSLRGTFYLVKEHQIKRTGYNGWSNSHGVQDFNKKYNGRNTFKLEFI